MKILITGTAGFIGYHLTQKLLKRGDTVVGIDNINDYYDVKLKHARLQDAGIKVSGMVYNKPVCSTKHPNYTFIKLDITDKENLQQQFQNYQFDAVCNLAAQAGVRYSLTNPDVYIDTNVKGFLNILECCRHFKINHLVYASSSSVYGLNKKMPFSEHNIADHPVSLYAASKKANEMMAHTYSHLFNLRTTGLRFFTVYGPWGRPDMALFIFTKAILEGRPIEVFNNGNMLRDFTYVDDIVEGIMHVIDQPAEPNFLWDAKDPDPATSSAPFRVFNIGRGAPVNLLDFVSEIEAQVNKKAIKTLMPMQDGDVAETCADVSNLDEMLNYKPQVSVHTGVERFIAWYKKYYHIKSTRPEPVLVH
ncbi:NAD-dependent epimerase [Mucilaginibacter sp. P25]|uniref:UDP-glucuronate 4-epimerase n=1 Tax=Mucilaginibacter gossypii TaxID=551996 RepID=A0A1G7NLK3_9SPHI|nr:MULTISPECIES: NAD-dependent epimerase [Mucilaginibacter]QTE39296.1 NAD-dependent epimerase [Mucilaginibacter gossypii]RAV60404.1 NAD-dependent epimerase [Mucilaginibacter rubeus]SDF75005.1 UDP-glucuronate 4-epimerase [Mucilaginibacter gossypii]